MNLQSLLNTLSVLIPILLACLGAWGQYLKSRQKEKQLEVDKQIAIEVERTKQMQIEADKAVTIAREKSDMATVIAQLQKDVIEFYKWKDRLGPEHETLKKQLERLIDDFQDHLQGEIDRYRNQFK